VECVLYGALETTVFEQIPTPAGPVPVAAITLGVVGLIVVAAVALFYKELLIGSFDPALAAALSLRPRMFHYLLMSLVAVVVVASLRSVGAVLVVGMIILPSATARFFSDRLRPILWLGVLFSFVSAVLGRHLAEWWNCPIAAAMAVASGMLFFAAWLIRACSRLWRWLE
jgi:manganese/zinc/iron transport system permease protein